MKKLAILVLAAGKSSRMKDIKLLLKIKNTTLLETTLNKVKLLENSDVYCVLGAHSEKIKNAISFNGVTIVHNPNFEKGLSTSIIAGIDYLNKNTTAYSGVFIVLADQPALHISFYTEMLRLHYKNLTSIIASKYKKNPGVPAIFPEIYFQKLASIEGDKGAKELLIHEKENLIFSNLPVNLVDIDTKEDYLSYTNNQSIL